MCVLSIKVPIWKKSLETYLMILVHAQPGIYPGKWNTQNSWRFWDKNRSSNLSQMTRPSDSQQKKENLPNSGLYHSDWPQDKTERRQKREINTWTLQENWKNYGTWRWRWYKPNWCTRYSHQRIATWTGGLENKRMSGDHLNKSIVEIRQNNKESLGDLRKLAVTQTPVENHQLMLVWKTLKWCLFVWVLWHINLCWLSNAKSIFIQ